jgi:hypothetical protein
VENLAQLVRHLRGEQPIAPFVPDSSLLAVEDDTTYPYDLADVRGQEHVKRAGRWWTLVDAGGRWWTLVDAGGLWWTLVDSGGLWWTLVDITF